MFFAPLLVGLLAAANAYAASLTITFPPSTDLPNPDALPVTTHATLSTLSSQAAESRDLRARITRNNHIVFSDLSTAGPASYLLEIHAKDAKFMPYRVDVSADGTIEGVWETFRGHRWEEKGADKVARRDDIGGVTVEARLVGRKMFYEERPKFSPLTLLKNPMILLGLVALVITVGMPKLMDSIDPEYREEFEKTRKESARKRRPGTQAAHAAAGFDLAGWMAGATAPESGTAATSGRQAAGSGERRRR
ncbi:hypothetical protein KEM56_000350 [Ascosphaera pollenicola]|nr:hypothetical protein KEM56_000350 [Ascosphaera pollenicola]